MASYFHQISDGQLGFILCLKCDEWSAVGDPANLPQQFLSHVDTDHPSCTPVLPDLGLAWDPDSPSA